MGRYSGKTCRLLTMFVLTTGFFLLEVVFGYITNSVALIADSFHMLSDVLALVIAFICMKFSKRTRSSKNTFGWVRAEVLGALINTVFLIALSFSIILEAIQRLFKYEYIRDPEHVLLVGIAGFVVNIIGLFLFHGHGGHGHSHSQRRHSRFHGHSHEGGDRTSTDSEGNSSDDSDNSWRSHEILAEQGLEGKVNNAKGHGKPKNGGSQMNMHGVFLHVLGDAFGSIVVIVNAVVNWQVDNEFLKRYLDPILSLVISLIIIGTSIPLLRESSLVLLQTVPPDIDVDGIQRRLLTKFGHRIMSVHEFHVWRLSGNKIVATAHIVCRENLEYYMRLAEKLKEFFHDEGIHSTTLQLELVQFGDPSSVPHSCMLRCPRKVNSDYQACTTDVCCVILPSPPMQIAHSGVSLHLTPDKTSPLPLPTPDLSYYGGRSSHI